MARKPKLDQGITLFVDRHGKERARFRLRGMDCYLPHPSSPEYKAAYIQAKSGLRPLAARVKPRSIGELCERFYASAKFERGGKEWQRTVKQSLEPFRNEARDVIVDTLTFNHIERILKRRAEKTVVEGRAIGGTASALRLHEQLVRIFEYAIKLKWISSNPAKEADAPFKHTVKGYHSWTEGEIVQFQAHHPFGSKARLALELPLWTGIRRGDVAKCGPCHVVGGRLVMMAGKTGKDVDVRIAPDLLAAIAAMPEIGETFLQTQYGKPFSDAGLGNWFRERCNEAGLPHCTIHGLRKAMARRAANSGATQAQLKAVGQWSNDAEVAIYTASADQRRLADGAIQRVIQGRTSSNRPAKVGQTNDVSPKKTIDMAGAGDQG